MTSLLIHFFQISSSLNKIVSKKLKFRKLCACWILKIFTDKYKAKHQGFALQFLLQ